MVGAGSVVSKSVPPYAIAAGNPARVVRLRFDPEVIGQLQRIAWWNWDHAKVVEALPLLLARTLPCSCAGATPATKRRRWRQMRPENITIAITVYNRRQYVKQAIASALDQTAPVRVMVVEDCGPDPTLQGFVKAEFGSRIEYLRNPRRRGLFGNWNACMELCRTEWLSILHDDDFLAPDFVEAMLKIEAEAPGLDLYFGQTVVVNERGEPVSTQPVSSGDRAVDEDRSAGRSLWSRCFRSRASCFGCPRRESVGGFRAELRFCGEWEMWAKLIARGGAAQTSEFLGFFANTGVGTGEPTGCCGVERPNRRRWCNIRESWRCCRRSAAWHLTGATISGVRPCPVNFLLRYGQTLSPRLLRYHVGLLRLSQAPHWRYGLFQAAARVFGAGFVRAASKLWNQVNRQAPAKSNP